MAHAISATQQLAAHSAVSLASASQASSSRGQFLGVPLSRPWKKLQSVAADSPATMTVSRRSVVCTVAQQKSAASDADVPSNGVQKGWSYSAYGSRDNITFGDVPVPELKPNQVLIRVGAAALNPVDFKRREGKFPAKDSPFPTVPGYDVAGTVVRVGSEVKSLKPGDEVYGDINEAALENLKQVGSLAQFTAAEEHLLARKPANLSFLEAAALPLASLTALEGFERAGFKKGQSVLILNGAGGVGTLAIQIAKQVYGASLIATTASLPKTGLLEGLGANLVLDYRSDFTTLPQLYDFVLDCIGDGERGAKVLKPGGKLVCIAGNPPPPAERFVVTSSGAELAKLTPYFESGKIRPVLDPKGRFKWTDVVSAFEHLESGRATGKVVLGPVA
ncbi:hypothetical protein CLOM_g19223 [Closterium sp. NIES-68]|nr:hypothetical protein CLOM_g19223 [Closterium sp. NIES-68]